MNAVDVRIYGDSADAHIIARGDKTAQGDVKVSSLVLRHKSDAAELFLGGALPILPKDLLSEDGGSLLPTAEIAKRGLEHFYAALRASLADLVLADGTAFFGLPAQARLHARVAMVLGPLRATADPRPVGLTAECRLAVQSGTIKGECALHVHLHANAPKIAIGWQWPGFGFTTPDLTLPSLDLSQLELTVPNVPGWLAGTSIQWTHAPIFALSVKGGVIALAVTGDHGQPDASGALFIDGQMIVDIVRFGAEGAIDALTVRAELTATSSAIPLPDDHLSIGPFDVAWTGLTMTVALSGAGDVTATLAVGKLTLSLSKPNPARVSCTFKYVTAYKASGTTHDLTDFAFVDPKPLVPNFGGEMIDGLFRLCFSLPLPQPGTIDEILGQLYGLIVGGLGWLADGAGSAASALLGLGRGAADLAERLLRALGDLNVPGGDIGIELRWDPSLQRLRQVLVSRGGSLVDPGVLQAGELSIAIPADCRPILVFDLVDRWMAVAVAPPQSITLKLASDLWLGSVRGTSAVRGDTTQRLVTLTAKLQGQSARTELVALALLRDGNVSFLQSLGSGESKSLGGVITIGGVLKPGDLKVDSDIGVELDKGRLTALFPAASGTSNPSAPKVTIKSYTIEPAGADRKLTLDLIVDTGIGDALDATITGRFDLRRLTLKLDDVKIPITLKQPIEALGMKLAIEPNKDNQQLLLRLSEAPAIELANDARATMKLGSVGDGEDVLTFEAVGPDGLSLGIAGVDLDAKVLPRPIRLPGLDTPFRFTSGQVRAQRGRLLDASVVGSGSLPPALLGDAKIDAAIQLGRAADSDALTVVSATARLERAGEPLVCEATRFRFELTHVGLGFKYIDGKFQFYGELTGSASFRPNRGEMASGLLARLPEIRINLDRAPVAGDGRSLAKAINFQVPVEPPAKARWSARMPSAREYTGPTFWRPSVR